MQISDPQVLHDVDKASVGCYVEQIRKSKRDPHEFATSYVKRTAQLGYAPDLGAMVREFLGRPV